MCCCYKQIDFSKKKITKTKYKATYPIAYHFQSITEIEITENYILYAHVIKSLKTLMEIHVFEKCYSQIYWWECFAGRNTIFKGTWTRF